MTGPALAWRQPLPWAVAGLLALAIGKIGRRR